MTSLVMRLLEEVDDRLRHHVADAVDLVQPFQGVRVGHGVAQVLERAKLLASSLAVVSPTCRMPSAKMKRSSAMVRRASMASNRLSADCAPQPSLLGQLRR